MYPHPSPHKPESEPSPRVSRRWRAAHVGAAASVAAVAIGLMGLKLVNLPEPAPVGPGEALKIEVVTPVEPELQPGSVMDVGELVDGFRYVPPRRAERLPVFEAAWEESEAGLPPYQPPVRRSDVRRYVSDDRYPEAREPAPREERRWFGFDNPVPDFRAERRARQARLEEMEAQRRAEFEARMDRRRYAPPPPPRERFRERAVDRPVDEPTEGPWGPEVG
jgi:hypothetical protein